MGSEVVGAVLSAGAEFSLTGKADPIFNISTVEEIPGAAAPVVVEKTLGAVFEHTEADAAVIFCVPSAAMQDIRTCMKHGVVPVIGTTGISPEDLEEMRSLAKTYGVGAIVAPNFAIGAILMMKFAAEAAKYLPAVEIIELHHDKKLDAPSGTSIKTAQMIAAARREDFKAAGEDTCARGENLDGVHIHSVRLPGLVAHQEVIFGSLGQTLTIRHDSIDRKSFMPGVLMALRHARGLKEVVYGLENII
jgi:4-hydroxy-tetrahydrodipicolinate reductase